MSSSAGSLCEVCSHLAGTWQVLHKNKELYGTWQREYTLIHIFLPTLSFQIVFFAHTSYIIFCQSVAFQITFLL